MADGFGGVVAEGFRIASAWVEVDPDTTDFRQKLQEQLDAALAGTDAKVMVGLDQSELDAGLKDAKAKLADLDGSTAIAELGLDATDFDATRDDAKAKLRDLDEATAIAELGLDAADFDGTADRARARLDELDASTASPRLGLDDTEFDEKLAKDRSALAAAGSSAGRGGLIGAIALGASSLLPGLGGAAAGMGLLAGTGALAFGSIGKALEAHSQASQATGTTSAQLAQTAFQNSVAIQQAQEAVGNAYTQAAADARSSAQQIQSAQTSLAEVTRNAAQQQIQAEQAVGQAEHQLADAQFAARQAQQNLTNARIQARLQLQQLNDAEKDAALNVRASRLALEQAQQAQQQTDANAMSTQLDKQEAALAVAQAQQQLTEAQQNATNSTAAANRANKAGVDGSQQVRQAKHAERDAIYAVSQAQQQAADAQRALTVTEKNNADQIRQAQRAVTRAEQQAAETQQRDARAIADAQRNLTDTYKEQQLAAAATASTSDKAASKFAADMAKMTPAGREFTRELLGMHGAWHKLQDIAQNAVLPGMTDFLAGVKSVLPEIDSGVRRFGQAMGDSFGQFGKLMQTPAFQSGLSGLITNGIRFSNIVLPAIAQLIQELGKLGAQKGAETGLANLLAGLARGLTGIARGIAPYTKQINQFLTAAGHILAAIGPPLGRIVGLIAEALGPLSRYLNAHPNGTVVKIIGDVVAGLIAMKAAQKLVIGPMGDLFDSIKGGWKDIKGIPKKIKDGWETLTSLPGKVSGIFSRVWGAVSSGASAAWSGISSFGSRVGRMMVSAGSSIAEFASGMVSQLRRAAVATGVWIAEHAVAAGTFIAENVTMAASATAAFIAENAATLGLVAGIAALVGAIIYLATHWKQVWGDIKAIALDVWHNVLDPMWHGIEAGAIFLYDEVIKPQFANITGAFHDVENAALWMWHNVLEPVWTGIEKGARSFVSGFKTVWGKLEDVFKKPVNFLIGTVYDKGIARLWNDVVSHIGLGSLKLPVIATMATGGIVPGKDTGRDNHLVAMRSEEGVLVPEAVRGLGGPGFVHAANEHFGGHPSGGSRGAVPGYSRGGIIGDIGGFFSGVGHDILSSAKFAAELATNPSAALTSIMSHVIGTQAKGDLARMMTGIPKALVGDLAKALGMAAPGQNAGGGAGTSGGLGGSATGDAIIRYAEQFVGRVPYVWGGTTPEGWDCSGFTDYVYEHFGFHPPRTAAEQQQWVKRTPGPVIGGLAFFAGADGTASDAGHVGIVTGINQMVDAYGTGFGTRFNSLFGSSGAVGGFGVPPSGFKFDTGAVRPGGGVASRFDSGGWMQPGTLGINQVGQPEAVLTPAESDAFVALVRQLLAGGTGGSAVPPIQFVYNGTQQPTPEQQAIMMRTLAMTLGGA